MDVVWMDTLVYPSKKLTKLSEFARAYATTTINEESKV